MAEAEQRNGSPEGYPGMRWVTRATGGDQRSHAALYAITTGVIINYGSQYNYTIGKKGYSRREVVADASPCDFFLTGIECVVSCCSV